MNPRAFFCTQTAHTLGGFQLWMDRMCQHLPGLGWDVVVGFAKGARFHDPQKFRDSYRHMHGVDIDGQDGTVEGRLLAVERACRKVKPDIVIPVLLVDANMAVARMKHKGSQIRHLYTYQGTHDWNIAEPERYADFIDMCCGCNVLATETLRKRGRFADERLASVPNGVPSRTEPVERPLQPNMINLAYGGRIEHPDKRVFDIPGMLDRLERNAIRFHLRIAGSGPQDEGLRARLSRHFAAGTVEHLGRLHFAEMHEKLYSRTDILLFPSPWEGWPLVVGEAIGAGIVLAAAAFRGVAKERVLIPDHNAVMYQVGDATTAGDMITELARKPEKLRRLSEQAYATALDFSWERCAERWSDVLHRTTELRLACGSTLPVRPARTTSRLSKVGVPVRVQVAVRKTLRRQQQHASGNAEWPYRDKDFDSGSLREMEADLLAIEQDAIRQWPQPYRAIRSLTRAESQ